MTVESPRRSARIMAEFAMLSVAILMFFQWDWLRPLVEAGASATLGRMVTMTHLDVRLGYNPAILLDGLSIAAPSSFTAKQPAAAVHHLEIDLMPWDLLHGQVTVRHVVL